MHASIIRELEYEVFLYTVYSTNISATKVFDMKYDPYIEPKLQTSN